MIKAIKVTTKFPPYPLICQLSNSWVLILFQVDSYEVKVGGLVIKCGMNRLYRHFQAFTLSFITLFL